MGRELKRERRIVSISELLENLKYRIGNGESF